LKNLQIQISVTKFGHSSLNAIKLSFKGLDPESSESFNASSHYLFYQSIKLYCHYTVCAIATLNKYIPIYGILDTNKTFINLNFTL
jgi:hypothetical protein